MAATIALVDDDRNILTSLTLLLEAEGYAVRAFSDSRAALDSLTREPADLAVLDIKMPGMDGLELLSRLRRSSQLPVIFLTSKDDEIDEVLGLKMGADDYVRKPFSERLLLERIRALLRRVELSREPSEEGTEKPLQRGPLVLDAARHLCTWGGEPVPLTVTEFLLVQALSQRPGIVKTRDQLMDAAYDDNVYVDDRTIDSHIKRMRRKFKAVDDDFQAIETLYGLGYRFRVP